MRHSTFVIRSLALLTAPFATAIPSPHQQNAKAIQRAVTSGQQLINLRIEGANSTIFEGPILSSPRNITTPSGGTHLCDGTNFDANPTPQNTPTDALDAASKAAPFPFDGTYDTGFADFFITSIGHSTQTATQSWGILLNYQFTPGGGCQTETHPGDHVLWAFDAFSKAYFLEVAPAVAVVKAGGAQTFHVFDGATGVPIPGAVLGGVVTDANGNATLSFAQAGSFAYKATRADSLRSNGLVVQVV